MNTPRNQRPPANDEPLKEVKRLTGKQGIRRKILRRLRFNYEKMRKCRCVSRTRARESHAPCHFLLFFSIGQAGRETEFYDTIKKGQSMCQSFFTR